MDKIALLESLTGLKVKLVENILEPKAACGVVISSCKGKILLGRAATMDDRNGKLCFLGGGIQPGETVLNAAKRETWEEGGIFTKVISLNPILHDTKPVAFVFLKHIHGDVKHNNEFSDMDWYDINNLPKEEMYGNNLEILQRFLQKD